MSSVHPFDMLSGWRQSEWGVRMPSWWLFHATGSSGAKADASNFNLSKLVSMFFFSDESAINTPGNSLVFHPRCGLSVSLFNGFRSAHRPRWVLTVLLWMSDFRLTEVQSNPVKVLTVIKLLNFSPETISGRHRFSFAWCFFFLVRGMLNHRL